MPPPTNQPQKHRSLRELVDELDLYPIEAFHFVQQGLAFTVEQMHGCPAEHVSPDDQSRHVSGQQLCEGLRRQALKQWGMLARTVLRRWNITSTLDFGRIVFALVENGHLQKTDGDSIDDFRNVFEFRTAFEGEYRIEHAS
jgi:uncharacterized repeat protein (TIGR04138 family)